jgi:hypothetical protein
MKKLFVAAMLAACSIGVVSAQNMQIGANLGPTMGVSMKYEMNKTNGFEGVFGYNIQHHGPSFKFMYEYSVPVVDVLSLYMGGGLHLGGYHMDDKGHTGDFAFGIVPTIGLAYDFVEAPISFGFGYEPVINFTTCDSWGDVAFKVRFRF